MILGLKGNTMSSSLDKLKALTSRLDDRLAQKRGESPSQLLPLKEIEFQNKIQYNSEVKTLKETLDLINASQENSFDRESSKLSNLFEPQKSVKKINIFEELKEEIEEVERVSDITVLIKAEEAEDIRQKNVDRVKQLYNILKIYEKSPDFDNLFMYKAMNLSGIGLKDDDFGLIRTGKYIQIIAITYEPDDSGKKKAKNISLGYFGKGEAIDPQLKSDIIEFVLCWRYEKAFQNVEHYKNLLSKVEKQIKEETISL